MNDRITMGSVSEKLLNFIDTALIHDSNYEIALIMVRNYEKVKHMSIAEMADLCYVSQATLSRFCRFLGYENFRHFREDLNFEFTLLDDYSRQFHSLLKTDDVKAAAMYRERAVRNIDSALDEANLKEIRKVTEMIHDTEHCAYFSHHFLWDLGHYFQSKMIMMGKYIELYQFYDNQLECAQSLDEKCLAVICTPGGSYFNHYNDLVKVITNSGASIVVITQNTNSIYINRADRIIRCGETNQDDTGKYAVLAVLDSMVLQYMKRYIG